MLAIAEHCQAYLQQTRVSAINLTMPSAADNRCRRERNGQKHFINGLVTNDKFCMSRQSTIKLLWSRKPYSSRPRKSAYAPAEISQQGGYHETPLVDTATVSGGSRRDATVGSRLPASPAMEPSKPVDRRSQCFNPSSFTIGGDI